MGEESEASYVNYSPVKSPFEADDLTMRDSKKNDENYTGKDECVLDIKVQNLVKK